MQAATSSLHPAIVSKGAELFAYAETKRERFMQMRVQKDVKGTVCKRCREDALAIPEDLRPGVFTDKDEGNVRQEALARERKAQKENIAARVDLAAKESYAAMKDSFIVRLLQDLNIAPQLGFEAEIEDMMVDPEEEMFSDISSVSSPRHFGFECGQGRGLGRALADGSRGLAVSSVSEEGELMSVGIQDWQLQSLEW